MEDGSESFWFESARAAMRKSFVWFGDGCRRLTVELQVKKKSCA
jgi:hypothetical protein